MDSPQPQQKSPSQPQPGTIRVRRVGSYAIGKTIGEGTFGKVRLGTHILTHERVALKILEKSRIQNIADMKRITREIQILKLLDHPNVVKLLEVIDTPKHIYLVMEYVEGGELFDYIVAHQRVAEPEAVHFFRDIIAGLDYCHKRHVIHRDLKPENLLIASDGHIKIVDFGLSNTIDSKNTLLKTACGSPCYAAPEMIAGKHYNGPCVDIWSTGVILYALTCGYLPFEDKTTALLYDKILKGRYSVPSHVSPALKDLMARMLTVDPAKRITIAGTQGMRNGIIHHEWYLQGLNDSQKEQVWREYGVGTIGGSGSGGGTRDGTYDLCTDSYLRPQQTPRDVQAMSAQIVGMTPRIGEGTSGASQGARSPVTISCLPRVDFRILSIMINQLGFSSISVKGAVVPSQSDLPIAFILRNLYLNKHNQMTATYYLVAEREWKKEKRKIHEANVAKGIANDPIQLPSVFPLDYKEQREYANNLGIEIVPYPRTAVEGSGILPEFWDFFAISSEIPSKEDEESEVLCRTAGWIISYNSPHKRSDQQPQTEKNEGTPVTGLNLDKITKARSPDADKPPTELQASPEDRASTESNPSTPKSGGCHRTKDSDVDGTSPRTHGRSGERHGRTHEHTHERGDRERHRHRRDSNGQPLTGRTHGSRTERAGPAGGYTEAGNQVPMASRRPEHSTRRAMATSSSTVSIEGSQLRMYIPSVNPEIAQRSKYNNSGAIPGCDFFVSYLPPEELVRRVLQAASGTPDPSTGLGPLGLGVKMDRANPYTIKIMTLSNHIAGSHTTEPSTSGRDGADDGKLKVSMPVRLEVEICMVKGYKGLHCIKTKRLAGGVWDYRIVICALLKRIKTE